MNGHVEAVPAERTLPIFLFSPVYFDVPSFLKVRERAVELLSGRKASFLVLDDSAGADPRVGELRSLPDVVVMEMPQNLGHQRALVFGLRRFLRANPGESLILTMDSDGEDDPSDIPRLIRALEESRDCRPIVLARRTSRQVSLSFRFFYFFYRRVFWLLAGTVIETGNFALARQSTLRKIIFHPYFDLSYSSSLVALGRERVFVPCARSSRIEGRSKMGFVSLATHGIRMLMPFMDKVAVRGVLAFSLLFVLALGLSFALIGGFLTGAFPAPLWLVLLSGLALVLCFFSICIFVVLITIFANVQALALSRIDEDPA